MSEKIDAIAITLFGAFQSNPRIRRDELERLWWNTSGEDQYKWRELADEVNSTVRERGLK